MHVGGQQLLVGWLRNMHGRHSAGTICLHTIFSNELGLILGKHARVDAKALPWPTYTAFTITVLRSSWWRFADLNPRAYTLKERSTRQRVLIIIILTLFCSLPDQHQGWQRRSMLPRKWAFRRPRWSAGPASLCIFNTGGLEFSKMPSFAGSGGKLPQNAVSAAMVMAGGWQKLLGISGKDKVHRPDRYSLPKHMFGATCIPNERWDLQISKSGPIVEITQT